MILKTNKFNFSAEFFIFVMILIIGIAVRFYQLGSVPAGLNQDEASMGYDAFSLLHFGVDRNNSHNPVHMISWGSGQNALQAYITIPFIAIFDLNVFTIRLVPAIWGVACLIFMYLMAKKLAGREFALLSMFLVCISPWHIVLSRWALESNILPGVILVSVLLLLLAQEHRKMLYVPFAFFALSLYAYSTAYAFVPVFLAVYGIYALWHRIYSVKEWIIACAIFGVIALPIALFVCINLFKLNTIDLGVLTVPGMPGEARYTHMTSFFSNEFFLEIFKNFKRVIEILFIDLNDRETQSSVKGIGSIYGFTIPFFVLGLFLFVRNFRSDSKPSLRAPILIWFFSAFFVAILTWPAVHRINLLYFPLILLSAYGIKYFFSKSKPIFTCIVIVYVALFIRFEKIYFTEYADEVGDFFFESYTDAVYYANKYSSPEDVVYLSDNLNQPYIHVLFTTKYNVNDYINTVVISDRTSPFQIVKSFGRFRFGLQSINPQNVDVAVAKNDELWRFDQSQYIVKPFKNYTTLFSRDLYMLAEDGHPRLAPSKVKLISPRIVSAHDKELLASLPDFNISNIHVVAHDFYDDNGVNSVPYVISDNHLAMDVKFLFAGINEVVISYQSDESVGLIESRFIVFKRGNDAQELLDIGALRGYQSFGALEINRAYEGSPLSFNGVDIPWGFGTHSDSTYHYALGKRFATLNVAYGISNASGNCGDGALFEILGDGKLLLRSDLLPSGSERRKIDIADVDLLEFNTFMKSNPHCDHTNWIAPVLTLKR